MRCRTRPPGDPVIYALLRLFFRFVLAIFYREIAVTGVVDPGGPLVLVANHPNTLMDPLLIASRLERRVHIIAKSTLFETPLAGLLLSSLGVLPVKRRMDSGEDPGGSNEDTFSACYEELARGGVILIFGEGTSHLEPRLMKLKTGAARIALGAERVHGPLGVRLVPVGLTYEAPELFGEDVRIRFSDPLPVLPFRERAEDEFAAARALTDLAESCLVDEVVHLDDPEHEDLLVTIDGWIGQELVTEERHRLDVTRELGRALNWFHRREPERVERFSRLLREYHAALGEQGVDDAVLEATPEISPGRRVRLALAAPIWLYGAVNHFVPYLLPRLIAGGLGLDPTYTSTVKLVSGILSFSLCNILQIALVWWGFGQTAALIYFATLPASGMLTLLIEEEYGELRRRKRLAAARERLGPEVRETLSKRRAALMDELKQAMNEYLAAGSEEPAPPDSTPDSTTGSTTGAPAEPEKNPAEPERAD